ncbi:UNVERIFIED_ORG: hypothetical protein FHR35_001885 [Microbispora rosea subsp. rosea]
MTRVLGIQVEQIHHTLLQAIRNSVLIFSRQPHSEQPRTTICWSYRLTGQRRGDRAGCGTPGRARPRRERGSPG